MASEHEIWYFYNYAFIVIFGHHSLCLYGNEQCEHSFKHLFLHLTKVRKIIIVLETHVCE